MGSKAAFSLVLSVSLAFGCASAPPRPAGPDPAVAELLREGQTYELGRGVPVNIPRAREAYDEACRRGSQRGCAALAGAFLLGAETGRDRTRARSLGHAACEAGERSARAVGEVVAVHIIPRPHANVDVALPLGRKDEAAKEYKK